MCHWLGMSPFLSAIGKIPVPYGASLWVGYSKADRSLRELWVHRQSHPQEEQAQESIVRASMGPGGSAQVPPSQEQGCSNTAPGRMVRPEPRLGQV